MKKPPEEAQADHDALRRRIDADLQAGQTVALSSAELGDPDVRRMLPGLLESMAPDRRDPALGSDRALQGYSVLGEIGRGGMSTVYLARDTRLDRNVALKKTRRAAGPDDRDRDRAVREAKALARLSHPNIVTVHDIVELGSEVVIVMEWVDGISLARLLAALPREHGADDLTRAREVLGAADSSPNFDSNLTRTFVRMVRDVARAVDHAHRAGLLHLDIKPGNVLIRSDGTPLLADFGVVREMDVMLSHTRSFAGTLVYAAPEQLRREDAKFGAHTDVYGLGMTLYELLARARPIADDSLSAMLRKAELGDIPRLSSVTEVATDLEKVVHKAIAPDPKDRYPSAAAFADDLTAFLDGLPVAATPATSMQRLRRWARREPWKAGLLTSLIVMAPVLTGLGTYLAVEMPNIRQATQRENDEQAARIAIDAFFTSVAGSEAFRITDSWYQRALELAPANEWITALMLTRLDSQFPQEAETALSRLADAVRATPGVAAVRRRLQAGRPFLLDAEADALAASTSLLDVKIALLDRIRSYDDSNLKTALDTANSCVNRLPNVDMMVFGLRAWIGGTRQDEGQLENACVGLATFWPEDPQAMELRCLGLAQLAPRRALDLCRELLESHPGCFPITLLAARLTSRLDQDMAAALRVLDGIVPTDESEAIRVQKARIQILQAGDERAAARELVEQLRPKVSPYDHLIALIPVAPQQAMPLVIEFCEREDATYADLWALYQLAATLMDERAEERGEELITRFCDIAFTRFPHYQKPRRIKAQQLFRLVYFAKPPQREYLEAAADLFEERDPSWRDPTGEARMASWVFCDTKRWYALLKTCAIWEQNGNDQANMHFYAGIGLARTGQAKAALAQFKAHAEAVVATKPLPNAFYEMMWIYVDPDGDPELRDPAKALALGRNDAGVDWLFSTLVPRKVRGEVKLPSPWYLLIAAEVCYANDDVEAARDYARRAEKYSQGSRLYAPIDLDERLAAAKKRYGL